MQTYKNLRVEPTFQAMRQQRGSYQIIGPCPACRREASFVVHATLREIQAHLEASGYACDACVTNSKVDAP